MNVWRRLRRILGQDRIRLPSRPQLPDDLVVGDRLQIGMDVWRVSGGRTAFGASCARSFDLVLEPERGATARLITTPAAGGAHPRFWVLLRDGTGLQIPPEMIIVFNSGRCTERNPP